VGPTDRQPADTGTSSQAEHQPDVDQTTHQGGQSNTKTRAKRHSHHAYSSETTDASELWFYPNQWWSVLEDGKLRYRAWMALEYVFPASTDPDHVKVVADCIQDALFDHKANGGLVEEGENVWFSDCLVADNAL